MTSRQPNRPRNTRKTVAEGASKKPKKPTNKKFGKRFSVLRSQNVAALRKNVRRLRKERGLSQAQLAEAVGVAQQAIGLIELARANPTLLTLEALAKALKTTVADLLTKLPRGG